MFPQQTVEELLSLAHVQAIAGQAGVSMSYFDLDYGFDGTFRSIRARGSRERVTFVISTNTQATFRGLPIKPFK